MAAPDASGERQLSRAIAARVSRVNRHGRRAWSAMSKNAIMPADIAFQGGCRKRLRQIWQSSCATGAVKARNENYAGRKGRETAAVPATIGTDLGTERVAIEKPAEPAGFSKARAARDQAAVRRRRLPRAARPPRPAISARPVAGSGTAAIRKVALASRGTELS